MNKLDQRLTFIQNSDKVFRNPSGKKIMFAEYLCACGRTTTKRKADVTRDKVKSCNECNGHRMSNTRFYRIWKAMNTRVNNPNYFQYKYWGGKGVRILWNNFNEFKEDMYEEYNKHVNQFGVLDTQIDRINGSSNYCKANCRWVTRAEQANNITIGG